jgi:hypothetical protein
LKRLSDRFLQLGVLAGTTGMLLGVWMGKTEDFTLAPVHAHINLLGWVSIVYRVLPQACRGRLPVLHFYLNVASFLVMVPSLALLLLGNQNLGPVLGMASLTLWLSMVLFAIIVIRATWQAKPGESGRNA